MVAQATMIAMALAGIFTVVLPLGLGIFFWKRTGGAGGFSSLAAWYSLCLPWCWSSRLIGCCWEVRWAPALQGNLWLYALYAGLMAGAFEECGRWLALKLTLRWSRGPEDALMYGAGHGGIEAVLLAGMTMLNNIIISLALNQGGLGSCGGLHGPHPGGGYGGNPGDGRCPGGPLLLDGL